jgi:hypothetical protein
MAKPIKAAAMYYDRKESLALRDNIIQLRDAALTGGHMEWAVLLSHTIAWMKVLIDERWPE